MKLRAAEKFLKHFKPGQVYRIKDLTRLNTNASHLVRSLVEEGKLKKVSAGKYVRIKQGKFGPLPPEFKHIVASFLNGGEFLLVDTNQFGGLWLGFNQVSMTPTVLNRKRDGIFNLYHHAVNFDKRRNFPSKLSVEFLILYMLETRTEDDCGTPIEEVFQKIKTSYSREKLLRLAQKYGKISTRTLIEEMLDGLSV